MVNEENASWNVVQECQMVTGDYDRQLFLKLVEGMPVEDFNRFSREIIHLWHFYSYTCGNIATDVPWLAKELFEKHPNLVWKISQVDFDEPISFRRVE